MDQQPPPHATLPPRWQPLSARERRVAGVLVEKAKTTPEAYPLSLNAVRTAANQKSNRFPTMELEEDQAQDALDRLRALGAVSIVQGGGRVDRYRHLLYEWLGVDKVELAVMTELLLRGAQTEGELRGRAARMEPIPDLAALRPVLDRLKAKNLIVSLTREGRGHVLTHNLYKPEELEKLRGQYAGHEPPPDEPTSEVAVAPPPRPVPQASPPAAVATAPPAAAVAGPDPALAELRQRVAELENEVEELKSAVQSCRDEIREFKDALGA